MANEQNLKPIRKGQLTSEEAKRRGSNGGKKSVASRREKKMLRQVAEEKLTEIMSNGKTMQDNLIQKAAKLAFEDSKLSDVIKFLEFMRDTSGQKPVDKVAQTDGEGNDVPKNDLSKIPTATLLKMAKAAGAGLDDEDDGEADTKRNHR